MGTEKIKISLIMANYNNGRYISEAIDSVLEQTFSNWELIIIDDCSRDGSLEIIKPYLKDQRVKLIINKENYGYGAVCKIGADNSSGEIVGFVDSDDALTNDTLENVLQEYEKDKVVGMVYSTHYVCDDKLQIERIENWVGSIEPGGTNMREQKVSAFRSFRKTAYDKTEGFNPIQRRAVDKDIYYKLEEVTKFKYLNRPLYYVRKNEKGISQGESAAKALICEEIAKYNAYKRRLGTNIPNLTSREISEKMLGAFFVSCKLKDWGKAIFFLKETFSLKPYNWKLCLDLLYRIVKFVPFRIYLKITTGSFKVGKYVR